MPRNPPKPEPVYHYSSIVTTHGFEARATLRKVSNHDDSTHPVKSCVQENGTADYPCAFLGVLPDGRIVLYSQYHLRCKLLRDQNPSAKAPASDIIVSPFAELPAEFGPIIRLIVEDFDGLVPSSFDKFKWSTPLLRDLKSARQFVSKHLLPLMQPLSTQYGTQVRDIQNCLVNADARGLRHAISRWILLHRADPQPGLLAYHGQLQMQLPIVQEPALPELPADFVVDVQVPIVTPAEPEQTELFHTAISNEQQLIESRIISTGHWAPGYDSPCGSSSDPTGFETGDEFSIAISADNDLFSDHLEFNSMNLETGPDDLIAPRVKRSFSDRSQDDDDDNNVISKRVKMFDSCFEISQPFGIENVHHNLGYSSEWPLDNQDPLVGRFQ
jgi:hypothetical protein